MGAERDGRNHGELRHMMSVMEGIDFTKNPHNSRETVSFLCFLPVPGRETRRAAESKSRAWRADSTRTAVDMITRPA
jgi:hypothetical protein